MYVNFSLPKGSLDKTFNFVHKSMTACIHPLHTAPVTKQGESPLAVAVREGRLDVIEYLIKECNANVSGESSVVVGLASGGSSKGLRVLEHLLALICPTQTYLLRSILNSNTSSKHFSELK